MYLCFFQGNVDVMKDLLHQGFNPNVRDNAGWSPLVCSLLIYIWLTKASVQCVCNNKMAGLGIV